MSPPHPLPVIAPDEYLRAYLLVDSELRRVEYLLRDPSGTWAQGTLDENQVLRLPCDGLSIAISLDDLYEDIALPPIQTP